MAVKKDSSKSNYIILGFIIAVCLSIPVMFFFMDDIAQDGGSEILGPDGEVREDYDPGIAWLQSKPIMMPDGTGGSTMLRATMRMKDRGAAKSVCSRHPHLADTILTILADDRDLMDDALEGSSRARKKIHEAIAERLGTDLFSETRISEENTSLMNDTDKVRYECGSEGLRLIFRNPPKPPEKQY